MKILTFPEDCSVGKILISKRENSKDWEKAVEARGKITVSESSYISFWLGLKLASTDLSFLESLKSNDLNEFLAATSYFSDSNTDKILHLLELDSLQLWETEITDKTLKQISKFSKLRVLGIDFTKITDAGLCHLSEMLSLEILSVYCNDISDESALCLANLNLRQLDLGWTSVGDDSVETLKHMKTLKYLRIFETKITESRFLELRKNLPDCLIQFHQSNNL